MDDPLFPVAGWAVLGPRIPRRRSAFMTAGECVAVFEAIGDGPFVTAPGAR